MSNETRQRWSKETDRTLRAAGWYPGRSVPTDEWENLLREHGNFEIHETARRFLTEFGGLALPDRGAGKTMARLEFRLDPAIAEWDDEIFDALSEEAGADLYPIGAADHRNTYLGIAPNGAVYLGRDSVILLANTAEQGLEKLVEGVL